MHRPLLDAVARHGTLPAAGQAAFTKRCLEREEHEPLALLAARTDLDEETYRLLLATRDANVRQSYAANPAVSDTLLLAMLDGERRYKVVAAVAQRDEISDELATRAAEHGHPAVDIELVKRHRLPQEASIAVHDRLLATAEQHRKAKPTSYDIRQALRRSADPATLLSRPGCSPDLLRATSYELSTDEALHWLRRAHAALTDPASQERRATGWLEAVEHVLDNTPAEIPATVLAELAAATEEGRAASWRRAAVHDQLLARVSNDVDARVNDASTVETLAEVLDSPKSRDREAAAQMLWLRPDVDKAILTRAFSALAGNDESNEALLVELDRRGDVERLLGWICLTEGDPSRYLRYDHRCGRLPRLREAFVQGKERIGEHAAEVALQLGIGDLLPLADLAELLRRNKYRNSEIGAQIADCISSRLAADDEEAWATLFALADEYDGPLSELAEVADTLSG